VASTGGLLFKLLSDYLKYVITIHQVTDVTDGKINRQRTFS